MEMMKKKILSILLSVLMIVSFFPVNSLAEGKQGQLTSFSDMPDNWSTTALQNAISNGLLAGDKGKIMPNDPLTRAQMATVMVRAFGATVKGDLSAFSDVKNADWFADALAKAYQMGVMNGSNGKMNPSSQITRQEVFVILARALKLTASGTMNQTFSDAGKLADWAKGAVSAMVNAGYISGSNGKLNPTDTITRAEFAQVMNNVIGQYIRSDGTVTVVSKGNLMVNVPGVTLKGLTVSGDLIIGDGVGNGEVTLDDVTVQGRMIVRGGGENSVIIRGNSSVSQIVVSRSDGAVSVKVQGDADVGIVYIDDGSDDVFVEGTVGTIEVQADGVTVTASGATITSGVVTGSQSQLVLASGSRVLTAALSGASSEIIVQKGAQADQVTISGAGATVSGSGTVPSVTVAAGGAGASVTTPGTSINVGATVSGVTVGGGTPVPAGSTATNNTTGTSATITQPQTTTSSSGGSSPPPTIPEAAPTASNVSISGAAQVGETLVGNYSYSDVNSDAEGASVYKWYANTGAGGTYEPIVGAVSSTYTVSAGLLGKSIKFEVTPVAATGTATGSAVMSAATSAVVGPSTLSNLSISGITDSGATLNFSSDQTGTYYYLVLASDAAAPDAATVAAQGTAAAKNSGATNIGANTANMVGLEHAKAYKAYLTVETAGGLCDVAVLGFTTQATVIDLASITGVTAPVPGATPVTTVTETAQYTGTVTWSPAHAAFKAGKDYTATITLAAKDGYTFAGVGANFFTVPGATAINAAGAGTVAAAFPTTKVTTAVQFSAALSDTDVTSIPLGANITGDVSATRTGAGGLTLNFGTYALTGNLTITANGITTMTLNGTATPAVSGNLTISAAAATVTNYLNVGGTITVNGVSDDTWIEYADGNKLWIDDNNGATIQVQGTPEDVEIKAGAAGINITVLNPIDIVVESGAAVNNIVVSAGAAGTTIENNGTLSGITANANTNIQNNANTGTINVIAPDTVTVGASGSHTDQISGVTVVTDISDSLGISAAMKMGTTTTATITGIATGGGETFHVISGDPTIISVDAATGLALTAQKAGRVAIAVQVKNADDDVIKQGTLFVTVSPASISTASVAITAPVAGAAPQTTAVGTADYDVSGLVWNGSWTPAGKCKAATTYQAIVTLTSKNGKAFDQVPFTPTVAGASSVGATTALGTAVGNSVTFTVTFPATAAQAVTGVKVMAQPTALTYTYGQTLNLAGLVIIETYNDGSSAVVTFAGGTADGYTANPANGATLSSAQNYSPVTITHTDSSIAATTAKLRVNNQSQAAPTGLVSVAATPGSNDGKINGTSALMEYKAASAVTYTAIAGDPLTNLAPGSYHVRLKAVPAQGKDPSPATIVLVPGLQSIALNTTGVKTAYKVGESLTVTGLIVTGTYTDGSTRIEGITTGNVSGFISAAVSGSQSLTVTLGGKTATYTISIAKADGPALVGVSGNNVANTMTGMAGGMEFSIDGSTWTAYDAGVPNLPDLTGELTLQVRVAATATQNAGPIQVFKFSAATLQSIAVTTEPSKTVYQVGEALDLSGLVVTGTYDSAPLTRTETIQTSNVTGFDSSAVTASQTLTVTIGGETATFAISVVKAGGTALVGVAADDVHNSVSGMTTAMEYNLDSAGYVPYNALTFSAIDFSGNHTLLVRMAETTTHNAGAAQTFTFTTNRYTLNYSAGPGGSITGTTTQVLDSGASGTAVTAVAATGYTFAGWSDGLQTATRTESNVASNKALTANFTVNQYTVTFRNHNGASLKVQAVNYGSGATAPANPSRPADAQYTYTFAAWDRAFTNITSDLTVTATYTTAVKSYTVTFQNYDGSTLVTRTVAYGSGATAPADPTRAGYLFNGWDVPFNQITGDLTVTATYQKNTLITAFDSLPGRYAGQAGSATYANAAAVQAVLPTVVTANNGAVTVAVSSWTNTDSYNPAASGSYTFTAVLGTIPTGFSNADNRTATVEVIVSGQPTITAGAPPIVGRQLTAGPGTLHVTTNLTYKWYRSADNQRGSDTLVQTGISYTPVEADIGNYLIVEVTSADATGAWYVVMGVPVIANSVTAVAVKTPPTKVTYTEGETLNLNGLVVTLTMQNTSTQDVAFADFGAAGITVVKANGAVLVPADTAVTISHTASGQSATQAITVTHAVSPISNADITISSGSIVFGYTFTAASGAVTYGQALAAPYYLNAATSTVTLKNGASSVTATVASLGIANDGTVSYTDLTAVVAKFPGLSFIPNEILLSLTGATTVNGGANAWTKDVTITLDPGEILLLTPESMIPPVVTAATQSVTNDLGQSVTARSSKTGNVMIILDGTPHATQQQIQTALNEYKASNAAVTSANTDVTISTTGLVGGTYHAYAVDENGNISAAGANAITIGEVLVPGAGVDKSSLNTALGTAGANSQATYVSDAAAKVPSTQKWVTQGVMDTYRNAIMAAQTVADNGSATQAQVNAATTTLTTATETFNTAKQDGTYTGVLINAVQIQNTTKGTTETPGTPLAAEIGDTLSLGVTMSDGQEAGTRVSYFVTVLETATALNTIGYIEVSSNSFAVPSTYIPYGEGGMPGVPVPLTGKYLHFGARIENVEKSGIASAAGPITGVGLTATPISDGASNPSTSVSLSGDTFAAGATNPANWTFNYGSTGLTVNTITLHATAGTATSATIDFTGTAAAGTLTIQAKDAALTGTANSSIATITITPELTAYPDPTPGTVTGDMMHWKIVTDGLIGTTGYEIQLKNDSVIAVTTNADKDIVLTAQQMDLLIAQGADTLQIRRAADAEHTPSGWVDLLAVTVIGDAPSTMARSAGQNGLYGGGTSDDMLVNTSTEAIPGHLEYKIGSGDWQGDISGTPVYVDCIGGMGNTAITALNIPAWNTAVQVRRQGMFAMLPSATYTVPSAGSLNLTGVGVNVANGTITGTNSAMQYSLDSTNGTDGTWASCTDMTTTVTFAPGAVFVRELGLPTNFRLVATFAPALAPIAEPVLGTFTDGTAVMLSNLPFSATGLEAAVAPDGNTYGGYTALTVNESGNASITGLTGIDSSSKVKIRIAATASAVPGLDKTVLVYSSVGNIVISKLNGSGTPYYNIGVSTSSLIPANNQITGEASSISTSTTVAEFFGSIDLPTGSSAKIVNALSIPGAFETWVFGDITGKADTDPLQADDLLLVQPATGPMRGYHLNVTGGGASAELSSLTENLTASISPALVSGTYEYALAASYAEDQVTLNAALDGATIKYSYGTTTNEVVVSGVDKSIPLGIGTTVITISVEKAGFTTKAYTLTVTRAEPGEPEFSMNVLFGSIDIEVMGLKEKATNDAIAFADLYAVLDKDQSYIRFYKSGGGATEIQLSLNQLLAASDDEIFFNTATGEILIKGDMELGTAAFASGGTFKDFRVFEHDRTDIRFVKTGGGWAVTRTVAIPYLNVAATQSGSDLAIAVTGNEAYGTVLPAFLPAFDITDAETKYGAVNVTGTVDGTYADAKAAAVNVGDFGTNKIKSWYVFVADQKTGAANLASLTCALNAATDTFTYSATRTEGQTINAVFTLYIMDDTIGTIRYVLVRLTGSGAGTNVTLSPVEGSGTQTTVTSTVYTVSSHATNLDKNSNSISSGSASISAGMLVGQFLSNLQKDTYQGFIVTTAANVPAYAGVFGTAPSKDPGTETLAAGDVLTVLSSDWSTIRSYTINFASPDATLRGDSTVKGATITSLGTPNANPTAITPGSVTLTTTQAADTSNAGDYTTKFSPTNDTTANVKVVKYANGSIPSTFETDPEYANGAITNGDFFIIRVTDGTQTLWYNIIVNAV